jgi:hypothetical protein
VYDTNLSVISSTATHQSLDPASDAAPKPTSSGEASMTDAQILGVVGN